MSGDAAIEDVAGTTTGLSQVERVVDAFIAPSKTFTDILRSSAWWLPFLLATVMSVISAYVIEKQVSFDTVVQNTLHDSPKQEQAIAEMEPKQRATQIHTMAISYRIFTYASPVFFLLIAAISSLALWGTFNFGLGTKTTYNQMLAVWMYASLPRILSSILMIVTLYGGNAEAFNLKNPVGTNPGFYLPDAAPWLRTLLSFVDVIGLWTVALLVIGTAIVAKVKRGQAAAVILGWWIIVLIISVAGAIIAS